LFHTALRQHDTSNKIAQMVTDLLASLGGKAGFRCVSRTVWHAKAAFRPSLESFS